MKRYIRSADAMSPGWSKRYNSELEQNYYVLAIPRRTATVTEFNDDGDYGYEAHVSCKDTGAKENKTFHGSGARDKAMDWCEKIIYKETVKSSTETTRWTDYLPEDVMNRLANCTSVKSDIPTLVDAKWRKMKEQGKDKQGFTKEDALVSVLDLLDSNSCDYELTRGEYEDLKYDATNAAVNCSVKQSITAAYDFSEPIDTTIQTGLFWDIDGHRIVVTGRVGSFQAEVTESWIAEDVGKEVEDVSMYFIGVDASNGVRSEYIYDPKYPDYKLYAGAAFNYPYDEEWDRKQQWKEFSQEVKRRAREEYSDYDEDDYTPSATRGDYSPSSPWNAPGMSIKDFI